MNLHMLFFFSLFLLNQSLLFSQILADNVSASPTANNFAYPQSVFIDPENGHIWVTDFDHHRVLRFDVSTLTNVQETASVLIPLNIILNQNYPNPFNSSTIITFIIAFSGECELKVYNILGQKVADLFNGNAAANKQYSIEFDPKNLPSGLYLYSLRTENGVDIKKMCLLK
jgi:hypothetical protein